LTSSSRNGAPTAATRYILDSSAVLALVLNEPGLRAVQVAVRQGAVIGAVNLAEVVSRLVRQGLADDEIEGLVRPLGLEVIPLDGAVAWRAGVLSRTTNPYGLSLGDRACLALAARMELPVLTADRTWSQLDVGVEVVLCR
jgi:PIN domain nuclease of toxin-antitoxin system